MESVKCQTLLTNMSQINNWPDLLLGVKQNKVRIHKVYFNMDNNLLNRVICLIDMDCFYCQVEEKLNDNLKGKPIAVVQYNQWKGGGIIAVNYEARARGVTRHMRGDEAKEICPEIELPQVPCNRGKADISKYREAGKDVANVLLEFTSLLERASIDEAYLDITKLVEERLMKFKKEEDIEMSKLLNSYVIGYDSIDNFVSDIYQNKHYSDDVNFDKEKSLKLLVGCVVVNEIRNAVYEKTGYRCSAGISHNKIMAKLVCGMNKPNKQTLLPSHCVPILFESLPVKKIKSLGGKFGIEICQKLNIENMSDLLKFTEKELQKHFDEKNGCWLYNIARGIDNDPVTPRLCPKSIGCCKKFPGVTAITEVSVLNNWLKELGLEIEERMMADTIENNRYPTQLVVNFNKELSNGKDISCSRSYNFKNGSKIDNSLLAETAFDLIKKDSKPFIKSQSNSDMAILMHPIKFLGITIGKFEDTVTHKSKISNFFTNNTNTNPASEKSLLSNERKNEEVISKSECPNQNSTSNTKLSKQESFFANYFRSTESIPSVSCTAKENYIGTDSTKDDQCDSDDSIGSIDLEINLSKQLINPRDEPSEGRPGLGEAFLNYSPTLDSNPDNLPPVSEDLSTAIQFINCEKCNENILSNEFSTHLDYHLAISLKSQDENTKTVKNLKDYFKINNELPSNVENIVCELCTECGKNIKMVDYLEHLDYHEAKKLSKELNGNKSINIVSNSTAKRKNIVSPKVKNKKSKTDLRTKSIESFFK